MSRVFGNTIRRSESQQGVILHLRTSLYNRFGPLACNQPHTCQTSLLRTCPSRDNSTQETPLKMALGSASWQHRPHHHVLEVPLSCPSPCCWLPLGSPPPHHRTPLLSPPLQACHLGSGWGGTREGMQQHNRSILSGSSGDQTRRGQACSRLTGMIKGRLYSAQHAATAFT